MKISTVEYSTRYEHGAIKLNPPFEFAFFSGVHAMTSTFLHISLNWRYTSFKTKKGICMLNVHVLNIRTIFRMTICPSYLCTIPNLQQMYHMVKHMFLAAVLQFGLLM